MNIKLFDVVLHPRLETSWIHFDMEATDQDKKTYYHRSEGFGGYSPPYPAFSYHAGKNHFDEPKYDFRDNLDPFDVNLLIKRLSWLTVFYEWEAGLKSLKFSNQVYVCPKTYVVWQSSKKDIEGTSYFEIKELPKSKHDFWCCREQYSDAYSYYEKH
jgi:hypothetical protein